MIIASADDMENLGQQIGARLRGGEVLELIGDVGAGKTTFTRGLARGLGVTEVVQSPSFTISCNYPARDNLTLNHYDFYRLADPGIVTMELAESITDPKSITVIEWGDNIRNTLPNNRVIIKFNYLPNTGRDVEITIPNQLNYLLPD